MIEQAVILAGGLGTRLGQLTQGTPKPMLQVDGRPFLDLLVEEVRRHGLSVLIVAGYCGEMIADHFAGDPDIQVVVEPEPLGTAGALRFARPYLAERFFLLNGDSFFDFNLLDLVSVADAADADVVLSVREVLDAGRYGAVVIEQGKVVRFADRGVDGGAGLINAGIAIVARAIVDTLPATGPVSIEQDVYPRIAASGRMYARSYEGAFIDIGIPADFERAQRFLPEVLRRGAVIFDRDGVLNEDVGYAHRPDQIRWVAGAIEAVKMVNDAGLFAFVATNQAGVARGFYEEEDVRSLHRWMNAELRRVGAHVDGFAYSPYHPEGVVEAYARVTDCRKPAPRMLLDLLESRAVDRDRVVMIGDKQSDIEAAIAAGVEGLFFEGGNLRERLAPAVARLRS